MLSQFDQLYKAFIRPGRQNYQNSDLGYKQGQFGKFSFKRHDFSLKNKEDQNLMCSFYEPIEIKTLHTQEDQPPFPCVVYAHCNTGSRIEGLQYMQQLITKGIGYFIFDFSGSGISQGDYISLGHKEANDLEIVIQYLKKTQKVSSIALWGRSMGAVTILLYALKDPSISCLIADSGFMSLRQLSLEVANKKAQLIPNFLIDIILNNIKQKIQEVANFDIDQVDLSKKLGILNIPIKFVCSKEDTFVSCQHSEKMHEQYGGKKDLYYVTGDHNAPRTRKFQTDMIEFLLKEFQKPKKRFQPSISYNANYKGSQIIQNITNSEQKTQSSKKTTTPQPSFISQKNNYQQYIQQQQEQKGSSNTTKKSSPYRQRDSFSTNDGGNSETQTNMTAGISLASQNYYSAQGQQSSFYQKNQQQQLQSKIYLKDPNKQQQQQQIQDQKQQNLDYDNTPEKQQQQQQLQQKNFSVNKLMNSYNNERQQQKIISSKEYLQTEHLPTNEDEGYIKNSEILLSSRQQKKSSRPAVESTYSITSFQPQSLNQPYLQVQQQKESGKSTQNSSIKTSPKKPPLPNSPPLKASTYQIKNSEENLKKTTSASIPTNNPFTRHSQFHQQQYTTNNSQQQFLTPHSSMVHTKEQSYNSINENDIASNKGKVQSLHHDAPSLQHIQQDISNAKGSISNFSNDENNNSSRGGISGISGGKIKQTKFSEADLRLFSNINILESRENSQDQQRKKSMSMKQSKTQQLSERSMKEPHHSQTQVKKDRNLSSNQSEIENNTTESTKRSSYLGGRSSQQSYYAYKFMTNYTNVQRVSPSIASNTQIEKQIPDSQNQQKEKESVMNPNPSQKSMKTSTTSNTSNNPPPKHQKKLKNYGQKQNFYSEKISGYNQQKITASTNSIKPSTASKDHINHFSSSYQQQVPLKNTPNSSHQFYSKFQNFNHYIQSINIEQKQQQQQKTYKPTTQQQNTQYQQNYEQEQIQQQQQQYYQQQESPQRNSYIAHLKKTSSSNLLQGKPPKDLKLQLNNNTYQQQSTTINQTNKTSISQSNTPSKSSQVNSAKNEGKQQITQQFFSSNNQQQPQQYGGINTKSGSSSNLQQTAPARKMEKKNTANLGRVSKEYQLNSKFQKQQYISESNQPEKHMFANITQDNVNQESKNTPEFKYKNSISKTTIQQQQSTQQQSQYSCKKNTSLYSKQKQQQQEKEDNKLSFAEKNPLEVQLSGKNSQDSSQIPYSSIPQQPNSGRKNSSELEADRENKFISTPMQNSQLSEFNSQLKGQQQPLQKGMGQHYKNPLKQSIAPTAQPISNTYVFGAQPSQQQQQLQLSQDSQQRQQVQTISPVKKKHFDDNDNKRPKKTIQVQRYEQEINNEKILNQSDKKDFNLYGNGQFGSSYQEQKTNNNHPQSRNTIHGISQKQSLYANSNQDYMSAYATRQSYVGTSSQQQQQQQDQAHLFSKDQQKKKDFSIKGIMTSFTTDGGTQYTRQQF